jgi:hypothetical protein
LLDGERVGATVAPKLAGNNPHISRARAKHGFHDRPERSGWSSKYAGQHVAVAQADPQGTDANHAQPCGTSAGGGHKDASGGDTTRGQSEHGRRRNEHTLVAWRLCLPASFPPLRPACGFGSDRRRCRFRLKVRNRTRINGRRRGPGKDRDASERGCRVAPQASAERIRSALVREDRTARQRREQESEPGVPRDHEHSLPRPKHYWRTRQLP